MARFWAVCPIFLWWDHGINCGIDADLMEAKSGDPIILNEDLMEKSCWEFVIKALYKFLPSRQQLVGGYVSPLRLFWLGVHNSELIQDHPST